MTGDEQLIELRPPLLRNFDRFYARGGKSGRKTA